MLPSSSLVPHNDPTLAVYQRRHGPVQGRVSGQGPAQLLTRRDLASAAFRAGGKHNDLENVGYTARHHTFFEMLGNFSFRRLLQEVRASTTPGISSRSPWASPRTDSGSPSTRKMMRRAAHLGRGNRRRSDPLHAPWVRKSNFWAMGDTGPCGPVFGDLLRSRCGDPRRAAGHRPMKMATGIVEIWNLVFMQYERAGDGTLDAAAEALGRYRHGARARSRPSSKACTANYDIDLFQSLIKAAADLTGTNGPRTRPACGSSRTTFAPAPSSSSTASCPPTRVAATCCGASSGVPSDTVTSWGRRSRSFISWCPHSWCARWAPTMPGTGQPGKPAPCRCSQQEEVRFAETLVTGMALLDAETAKLTSRTR